MSRGTVLVVEDEPRLRFVLHAQLKAAGFDIVTEADGGSALSTLKTLTPDLILLNIHFPDMDGVEVCKLIRADKRVADIPVIFLTFLKDNESRARCVRAGANDYVTKPWEASDLIQRIDTAIASARS